MCNFIDHLENCLYVLYKEGNRYKFSHRSFQEYFVAYFLNIQTDSKMRDYSFHLIESGKFSTSADSVFFMLEDMNTQRFNSNILIPLLDKFEKSKTSDENLLEYYILNLPVAIEVNTAESRSTRDFEVRLYLPTGGSHSFIYNFFEKTINYNIYKSLKPSNSQLVSFCKANNLVFTKIDPRELIKNKNLFKLFKNSDLLGADNPVDLPFKKRRICRGTADNGLVFAVRRAWAAFGGLDVLVVPFVECFAVLVIETAFGDDDFGVVAVAAPCGIGLWGGEVAAGLVVARFGQA